ncbi:hypothetical protein FV141_00215 [Dermacoccus abyssi]|uniref:Uncharacterized protein n=1 Tax=Dermacoccus abyssi TaxID=322596 RepID=A0ABX5Z5X7_9MICO|nr:hypothetical protein FV141_00215 [Dermacoccus abyssi]
MSTSPSARGTFREDDGSPVAFAYALKVWTRIGYALLLDTATRYNAVTTYKELTTRVQDESGLRTTTPSATLAGKILELCAVQAAQQGEPPLTSLCLKADGTVGAAYWRIPTAEDVELPAVTADSDVEAHAAEHRLLCYRKHATDLPADGGTATLPEHLVARRERTERRAEKARIAERADAPKPVCPTCFTQLPANGICWQCD